MIGANFVWRDSSYLWKVNRKLRLEDDEGMKQESTCACEKDEEKKKNVTSYRRRSMKQQQGKRNTEN